MSAAAQPPARSRDSLRSPTFSGGAFSFREVTRGPIVRIVLLAIGLRVLSALLAFLSNIVFPLYSREQFTVFGRTHLFWDTFARYDSGWYYGIARNGYQWVEGGRNNLAFFPVYPLLMRYAGRLLGGEPADYYIGGVVVSWIAFVLAMVMLYRLARVELSENGADRAVLYAAIFPFAFFYGVAYSESVFLLFTVTSFYGFRTSRWMLGGLGGALASATRVTGIMTLPALAYIAWKHADRRGPWRAAVSLALVAGGLVAYSLYVYALSGSFVEWMTSIRRWGYHPGGQPWQPLFGLIQAIVTRPYQYLTGEHQAPYDLLNGGTAIGVALAVPFIWMRLGAGYGLFMAANLWLPLSSGQFEGLGRYCAVLFPFFLWLASFRSDTLHAWIVMIFPMLYMLCLALFTTLHPIF